MSRLLQYLSYQLSASFYFRDAMNFRVHSSILILCKVDLLKEIYTTCSFSDSKVNYSLSRNFYAFQFVMLAIAVPRYEDFLVPPRYWEYFIAGLPSMHHHQTLGRSVSNFEYPGRLNCVRSANEQTHAMLTRSNLQVLLYRKRLPCTLNLCTIKIANKRTMWPNDFRRLVPTKTNIESEIEFKTILVQINLRSGGWYFRVM